MNPIQRVRALLCAVLALGRTDHPRRRSPSARAAVRLSLVLSLLWAPGAGLTALGRDAARLAQPVVRVVVTRGSVGLAAVSLAPIAAFLSGSGVAAAAGGGTPWAWGGGSSGQLGDGTTTSRYAPAAVHGPSNVGTLDGVTAVVGGAQHSLALKGDGRVWAWGANNAGQLGTGNTAYANTPMQVTGLTDVTAIASHGNHNLGLKRNGTVWAWGSNSWSSSQAGQLGSTTTELCGGYPCSTTPLQVSGLTNVKAIATGDYHSLALKSDGTVWAWGYNFEYALGDGTSNSTSRPVQVHGALNQGFITGVVAIAAGGNHSLAIRDDGTAWAWGRNAEGQLGAYGGYNWLICPVQVTGLTGVRAIVGGHDHNLALKDDGSVWAWGTNASGQLGDGTTTPRNTPVQVHGVGGGGTLGGVSSIAAGSGHSLARRSDTTVVGWGLAYHGQLGTTGASTCGGFACSLVPVQSATTTPMTAVAAGDYHSLAVGLLSGQAAPANTGSRRVSYVGGQGDPVQTDTGGYLYTKVDLAIPGRGPSPAFTRSYNSFDTRVGPLGPGWTHTYAARLTDPDGTGAVLLVSPEGRSDRYTPNADGWSFAPPPSIATTLARNPDGTYTATRPDRATWTFSGDGRLIGSADRYGNTAVLSYNTAGQLTAVADPAGRGSLALAYDATSGRLTSVTDWQTPSVRVVRYGYDASGRLQTVTDREGKVTTFAYEGTSARVTTITDANAHVAITNHYDASGRVDWQQDARGLRTGQQTTLAYVANGDGTRTVTGTAPRTSLNTSWNPQTIDTYDAQGRLTQRVVKPTSTETYTTSYAYDANFFTTAVTDARRNTTSFCYDVDYAGAVVAGSRGNLTRTIAPPSTTGGNPLVTLYKYDAANNLLQTVPPKGVANGATVTCATNLSAAINGTYATDYAYDAATSTKLLSVTRRFTDPELGLQTAVTKYEYADTNNPGMVTRVIPPRGNTGASPDYTYATTSTFNATGSQAGLLASVVDPLGNTTTYGYDPVGRRTATIDPLGNATGGVQADHTWTYEYDKEDRLRFAKAPAPVAGGALLVAESRYDAVGNRTVAIDPNGQVTTYAYDERDSLKEVDQSPSAWTDPAVIASPKIATTYGYDDAGNLTTVTRAQGDASYERVTGYLYDGLNRLRQETQYPAWPTTSPTLITQYGYDASSNRTTLVDPLGRTTTLGYDPLNRLTALTYSDGTTPNVAYTYDANSNRLTMADGTGTTSYSYDELNRATAVTSPGPVVVGYRYDLDGDRTKLIYPDGTAVAYAFNKGGQLGSLSDWATPARTTGYAYAPDGRLKTTTNPNSTTTTASYDNAQRLTQVLNQQGASTLSRHAYTLDPAGNRTQLAETLTQVGGGTTTPSTTYAYDRLYRLTGDGARAYTYDGDGNRLTQTVGGTTTSYAYDRADRVQSAGSTSYTLDAVGNTTARGSDSFGYDQANRLKTATVVGTATTYAYDGDGKRASATTGGVTTAYAYDANRSLPVLLADGARKYVWGAAGLAYSVDGAGAVSVAHADGLGSVRALTNGSGTLTQTYLTDPFGGLLASSGTSAQPFQFTGEQKDATGLYFLRARMYDPVLGRFLSRDVYAGETDRPGSLHRYTYVENQPVNAVDPSGHCGPLTPLCVAVAVAALDGGLGTAVTVTAATAIAVGTSRVLADSYVQDKLKGAVNAVIASLADGIAFAQQDGDRINAIARTRKLTQDQRRELGRAVEEYKRQSGIPNRSTIGQREIERIADEEGLDNRQR